jgi:hypothetical protein
MDAAKQFFRKIAKSVSYVEQGGNVKLLATSLVPFPHPSHVSLTFLSRLFHFSHISLTALSPFTEHGHHR